MNRTPDFRPNNTLFRAIGSAFGATAEFIPAARWYVNYEGVVKLKPQLNPFERPILKIIVGYSAELRRSAAA